jgi:hypothetical protein
MTVCGLKRERWEAYNKVEPGQHQRTHALNQFEVVPPMSVRAGPGGTTTLMIELLGKPHTADSAAN